MWGKYAVMDNTILTVIISATASIFVAAIPAFISLWQVKIQLKESEKKAESEREANQKELIDKLIITMQERNKTQDEALRCLLRTQLLNMYFKHAKQNNPVLTQWESENMHKIFEAYSQLDGNSFAEDVFNKMNGWNIVQN